MLCTHKYRACAHKNLTDVSGPVDRRIRPHHWTIEAVRAYTDYQRHQNLLKGPYRGHWFNNYAPYNTSQSGLIAGHGVVSVCSLHIQDDLLVIQNKVMIYWGGIEPIRQLGGNATYQNELSERSGGCPIQERARPVVAPEFEVTNQQSDSR